MGGRVCQREPNEIVLKFHLVAKLQTRSGKGRKGMVRRSRSEREREENGSNTANEQNDPGQDIKACRFRTK